MFKIAGRIVANTAKLKGSTKAPMSSVDKIIPLPMQTAVVIFEEHHQFVEEQVARLFPNSAFLGKQMSEENLTREDCAIIRERVKETIILKQNQQQLTDFLHRMRKHVVMDKGKDCACDLEDILDFSEKLFDMQKKVARELRREAERQAISLAVANGKSSPSSKRESQSDMLHRMEEIRKVSEAQLRVCNKSRPVRAAALLSVCGAQSKNFDRLKPAPSYCAKTHCLWAGEDFATSDEQPDFAMLAPSLKDHGKSPPTTRLRLPRKVNEDLGDDDALDVALATARGTLENDEQLANDSFSGKFAAAFTHSVDVPQRGWDLSTFGGTMIGSKFGGKGSCAFEADSPQKGTFMVPWPAA